MGLFDRFKIFKKKPPLIKASKGKEEEKVKEVKKVKEPSMTPEGAKEGKDKKVKKVLKKPVREIKRSKAYKILLKPLITEKATDLKMYNQYVFEVAPQANKIEIKKSIQSIYKVTPLKVRIIHVSGKNVRYGRTRGKTKNRKKAIITLKSGDKMEIFEGV